MYFWWCVLHFVCSHCAAEAAVLHQCLQSISSAKVLQSTLKHYVSTQSSIQNHMLVDTDIKK